VFKEGLNAVEDAFHW